MLDITYLLFDKVSTLDNSPVFQSQILDWILLQKRNGINVGLICTVQDMDKFKEIAANKLKALDVPFVTIPNGSLIQNIIRSVKAARRFNSTHGNSYICVRNIWGALVHKIAFPVGPPKLIYDFRGDLVAESYFLRGKGSPNRKKRLHNHPKILNMLVKLAVNSADKVCCVSVSASRFISKEYRRSDSAVIPSGVDYESFSAAALRRKSVRKSLSVYDSEILLVYSGGLSAYQMVPEMLNIWSTLQYDKDVKFLLLTGDAIVDSAITQALEKIDKSRINIMSLPREKVPEYLGAADVGFLLRKEDDVNEVASPIKFGEYLASGLAIITSSGIGDSSQLVTKNDLGILVNPESTDEAATRTREFLMNFPERRENYRLLAQESAKKYLDWSTHISKWKKFIEIN